MSEATVKCTSWQPSHPPKKEECADMRQIVVQAAVSLTSEGNVEFDLLQLYRRSQQIVRQKRDRNEWNWPYRSKRTWDRRVNSVASKKYGAKLVAVTAGKYKLNPKLFTVRVQLNPEVTVEPLKLNGPNRQKYEKTTENFRGRPKGRQPKTEVVIKNAVA